MNELPFSPACERNKGPIADVLKQLLPARARVLEVGAGTGQHAVHFTECMPGLNWLATDVPANLAGLAARFAREAAGRLAEPQPLDVAHGPWPAGPFEAVYTANTLHIMPFSLAPALFAGAGEVLVDDGCLVCYGPFMDDGVHSAASNRQFDLSLRDRDPTMGIRDTRDLERLAEAAGLRLDADIELPANNRILVFRRTEPTTSDRVSSQAS